MIGYEPEPGRPGSARRAFGAVMRVAVVLAIVLAGIYFIFTGGGRPDRHALRNLNEDRPLIGASLGDWPSDSKPLIREFESKVDTRLDIVDVFLDWRTPVANVTHTLTHIANAGSIAQLSWEPQGLTTPEILAGTRHIDLRDGTNPNLDDYLESFATGVCAVTRETGQPILVRTMHEFNGGWFSWGISYRDAQGNQPNSDASYKQAWIKIHDAFGSRCGSSVKMVWAVNHFSVGEGASYLGPYPGDAFVDYIGIDGYNWGAHEQWGWQTFDIIFLDVYCQVSRATPQPILVAEVGSTEAGGDKAAWIREMFDKIADGTYSRIQGVIWFNTGKYERESRTVIDWQVDSSPEALQAFSEGAQHLHSLKRLPEGGPACPG